MPDFGFDCIPTDLFFDRPRLLELMSKGSRDAQSRAGAFIMTRMRSSIRSAKSSAKPGKPPHSHTGDLKNKIFFAFSDEAGRNSVVIGPLVYKKGEAPGLLEFGGDVKRNFLGFSTDQQRRSLKERSGTFHYRGNPFAKPALDAEIDAGTIPEAWSAVVKD
ncbi:MAG: hypothetical protein ABSF29_12625 [Tepidisphaeraceae bacterium]|jgi:hypothetical protein